VKKVLSQLLVNFLSSSEGSFISPKVYFGPPARINSSSGGDIGSVAPEWKF
jgi:hypothetical protein